MHHRRLLKAEEILMTWLQHSWQKRDITKKKWKSWHHIVLRKNQMIKNDLIKTCDNNTMSWIQSEQVVKLKRKVKKS